MTTVSRAALPSFDELPDGAYVRASSLVRNPKHPERVTPLQMSKTSLWRLCAPGGTFPKPVKLSDGITCWNVGQIRRWLAQRLVADGDRAAA